MPPKLKRQKAAAVNLATAQKGTTVQKDKDAKRKQKARLGEAIIKWEERIEKLENSLEPWRHPKGKPRSEAQHVMMMESALFFMKQAQLDA
eukprot:4505331-Ditylum_brightwellii.AAC.1